MLLTLQKPSHTVKYLAKASKGISFHRWSFIFLGLLVHVRIKHFNLELFDNTELNV